MMIGILRELFYGNITPFSAILPKKEAYRKEMDRLCREERYWRDHLSPEEYQRLEQLLDAQEEVAVIAQEETFCYAFSLGAQVAFEALSWKGEIIK